ncbi:FAD-binding protein [Rossellomorea vietnamensis]|uniref:FAD-binding protein n=1 Tax=Rossellomorea vietnamensis TaxID=218284 RepID=A0A5D4ME22_9BACI|nr:FAD-dependent oxidoreductase [Rossellomorea vietnamensis]TYR99932.1 FAD-binding protein [Rossellomorea vietnamensis]
MVVGELAEERELVIIGGGPGGYHAAIRAAQLGLSVLLIEKENLGGVCLNKGCIPSKVFTQLARKHKEMGHYQKMGLDSGDVSVNLSKLQDYKNSLIDQLKKGVNSLCGANKVEIAKGTASFLSANKIGVENGHSFTVYSFQSAIIATGAKREKPSFIPGYSERIVDEFSIYELSSLPEELAIYGSSYIELEAASSFAALGTKVTLVMDGELPFDDSINKELTRVLKKMKVKMLSGFTPGEVTEFQGGVSITLEKEGSDSVTLETPYFFAARKITGNVEGLGVDRLKMGLTVDHFIEIDEKCRTSIPGIYAVGDAVNGSPLAVKAIRQGKVAAENAAGLAAEYDGMLLPDVAQTIPPVASIGLTEKEAAAEHDISVSTYPMGGNGFAQLIGEKEGLIKVVSDSSNDLILGIHMIGSGAVEMISGSAVGMEMAGRDEDFAVPYYPHPNTSESLQEAMEALKGKAVHLPPKKQKEYSV